MNDASILVSNQDNKKTISKSYCGPCKDNTSRGKGENPKSIFYLKDKPRRSYSIVTTLNQELPFVSEHRPNHKKFFSLSDFGKFLSGLFESNGWLFNWGLKITLSKKDVSLGYGVKGSVGYGRVFNNIKHMLYESEKHSLKCSALITDKFVMGKATDSMFLIKYDLNNSWDNSVTISSNNSKDNYEGNENNRGNIKYDPYEKRVGMPSTIDIRPPPLDIRYPPLDIRPPPLDIHGSVNQGYNNSSIGYTDHGQPFNELDDLFSQGTLAIYMTKTPVLLKEKSDSLEYRSINEINYSKCKPIGKLSNSDMPQLLRLNKQILDNSWLAGFTQACGVFHTSIVKSKINKLGYRVKLEYCLKHTNITYLYYVYNYLSMGKVYWDSNDNIWKYKSSSFKLAGRIINYFDEFNVFALKYVEYVKYRKVYLMVLNNIHLQKKGINKIKSIANKGTSETSTQEV